MQHNPNEPKGNAVQSDLRSALFQLIEAHKAQMASLEALASAVTAIGSDAVTSGWISEADATREYPITRNRLRTSGLPFTRGPKQRRFYDRRAIVALLEIAPAASAQPHELPANETAPADPLDMLLASGRLRRVGRSG